MQERGVRRQFVRSGCDEATKMTDDIDCVVSRMEQESAQDGMNLVRFEFERSDNAEIPTPAAKTPEEVLVFARTGAEHSTVCDNRLAGQQIVDRHAVLANQPAHATAHGEARDARLGHDAARDCKAEDVRFAIQITEGRATLHANGLICRIGMYGAHARKVYDKTIVTERATADVMAAAADGREESVRASEVHRGNHIGDAGAAGDQSGTFVDARVPDLAGVIIAGARRLEQLTMKRGLQGLDIDRPSSPLRDRGVREIHPQINPFMTLRL